MKLFYRLKVINPIETEKIQYIYIFYIVQYLNNQIANDNWMREQLSTNKRISRKKEKREFYE